MIGAFKLSDVVFQSDQTDDDYHQGDGKYLDISDRSLNHVYFFFCISHFYSFSSQVFLPFLRGGRPQIWTRT